MNNSSQEMLATALARYQAGDLAGALSVCEEAVAADPQHASAQHHLGVFLLQSGRREKAVERLLRASELDPQNAESRNHLGVALAGGGKLEEAVRCFEQAIELHPELADAHYNLAGALRRLERCEVAAARYRQALHLRPHWPEAQFNLANALRDMGRWREAAAGYRKAVELRPGYAKALNNLGDIFRRQGSLEEAAGCFRQALRARPNYREARHNLGLTLRGQGKVDESLACYREAAARSPESAAAHAKLGEAHLRLGFAEEAERSLRAALRLDAGLAEAHLHLGQALRAQERLDEAAECFEAAIRCGAESLEAHVQLGDLLREQGRLDEAAERLRQGLAVNDRAASVHNMLGAVYFAQGKAEEAIGAHRQALRLRPDMADAHTNLGAAFQAVQRYDESLAHLAHAVRIQPDLPVAQLNRALVQLRLGDFDEGWLGYEWRRRCEKHRVRDYGRPLWDGGPLEGKTILLHAEQGLGDTFQFIRLAPLVKARGGRVLVECQRAALPMLRGCAGVDQLLARGEPLPEFQLQAPLLSLPLLLGITLDSIPADAPYLFAEERLVAQWGPRLAQHAGFKVGLSWQGNRKYPGDHLRSAPLACFRPLGELPGVRFFSLQKKIGTEQLEELKEQLPIVDFGEELDAAGPFLDTAAIMKNLDLVITTDTAVAHLAGALDVPTWLALGYAADWRWLTEREDSPWYPSMRLFRQRRLGDWDKVFERMAEELAALAGGDRSRLTPPPLRRSREVEAPISPGELLDKISILQIKSERIDDQAKLANVRRELAALARAREARLRGSVRLDELAAALKGVNEELWEIEDEIRLCERAGDFGPRFIELARAVYQTNDRRAAVKREINERLGSALVEEKAYVDYAGAGARGEG